MSHQTPSTVLALEVPSAFERTDDRVSCFPPRCGHKRPPHNPCLNRASTDYQPLRMQRWYTYRIQRECGGWFLRCWGLQNIIHSHSPHLGKLLRSQCRWWKEPWTGIAHYGISRGNLVWTCWSSPLRSLCNIRSVCSWTLHCGILGGSSGRSALFSYHYYCCLRVSTQVLDHGIVLLPFSSYEEEIGRSLSVIKLVLSENEELLRCYH